MPRTYSLRDDASKEAAAEEAISEGCHISLSAFTNHHQLEQQEAKQQVAWADEESDDDEMPLQLGALEQPQEMNNEPASAVEEALLCAGWLHGFCSMPYTTMAGDCLVGSRACHLSQPSLRNQMRNNATPALGLTSGQE